MSNTWPHETIKDLLELAEASGEAKALLTTPKDAELFRYAIYSFRRKESIHPDISITLDDCTVILTKRVIQAPQILNCSAS